MSGSKEDIVLSASSWVRTLAYIVGVVAFLAVLVNWYLMWVLSRSIRLGYDAQTGEWVDDRFNYQFWIIMVMAFNSILPIFPFSITTVSKFKNGIISLCCLIFAVIFSGIFVMFVYMVIHHNRPDDRHNFSNDRRWECFYGGVQCLDIPPDMVARDLAINPEFIFAMVVTFFFIIGYLGVAALGYASTNDTFKSYLPVFVDRLSTSAGLENNYLTTLPTTTMSKKKNVGITVAKRNK